jgi:lipid A 3-O-deacylase
MKNKLFYALLILLLPFQNVLKAQVIDNISTIKNINSTAYFRFNYDNDYFTATDEYYTQGILLELIHPQLRLNPFNKLLLKSKGNNHKYGVRLDSYGYTPTSISTHAIRYGDRPFCGNLSLSSFIISADSVRKRRISTTFTVGVMGSKAGGEAMQVKIHTWLKNIIPVGWEYQIGNDLILNYQLNYEKELVNYNNLFLINSNSQLQFGTHDDKIKTGFNFMLGRFNNPYLSVNKPDKNKFNYHFYGQLLTGFTAYDATLQGGLFNRNSPYTIAAKDMTRLTLQGDFGVSLNFKKLYLEYTQSFISKEFKTGYLHRYGGIRIGVAF